MTLAPLSLRSVVAMYRWQLVLTYTLFSIEMLGSLMRPYFLGEAVDGLLEGHYRGLFLLSGVHLTWLVVGTIRHMYDTRTFSAVYTTFVTRLLSQPTEDDDLSRRSALSTLARQVTDFMEFDVNYLAEMFYNVIGSMIVLFIYDRWVVAICVAVLVPVIVLGRVYGIKVTRLTHQQFDEIERQVDVIATRDEQLITQHYHTLRRWQIRISDLEAWNFGVLEVFVLVTVAGALLISARTGDIPLGVGAIIGMYSYVLRFASGLETIPYMVQRLGALRDILRRVSLAD